MPNGYGYRPDSNFLKYYKPYNNTGLYELIHGVDCFGIGIGIEKNLLYFLGFFCFLFFLGFLILYFFGGFGYLWAYILRVIS
jgi:hypothetical protein